jgi:hypothetical protein
MSRISFSDGKCTVTEASNWLQVSRETIYNWIRAGKVSYIYEEMQDPHRFEPTKFIYAEDLDYIRHNRIVAVGQELARLQAIPSLA